MPVLDENILEQTTLGWFHDLGYGIAFGPDISPDGSSCGCWVSEII
ncbi:MAG: hypothetical protein JRC93_03620 [Deltaproteobacteria bacterium]|nr:hypothetical protein [Deltaproteobacteria bacterium]